MNSPKQPCPVCNGSGRLDLSLTALRFPGEGPGDDVGCGWCGGEGLIWASEGLTEAGVEWFKGVTREVVQNTRSRRSKKGLDPDQKGLF